jgi:hypothetical protein
MTFFETLGRVCLILAACILVLTAFGTSRYWLPDSNGYRAPEYAPPVRPQTDSEMMTLLPGQIGRMHNRQFRKVEIHSQYPIHVMTGGCESTYTVDYSCDGDPDDVVIQDLRRRPIFSTPRSNVVTFKFSAY